MKFSRKKTGLTILTLLIVLLCATLVVAGVHKGPPLSKELREQIQNFETERLNSKYIEQDQSKIPVKVYDENGNLILETNSKYYIEHQDEIYQDYKKGNYSKP